MGEQSGFAERSLAGAGDDFRRYAGQVAEQGIIARQGQRNQRRARLDDLEAETPSNVISEAGCAQFGDRQAAGGEHEARGGGGADVERAVTMFDRRRFAERHVDPARDAFVEQHRDDLLGRAVAE